MVSGSPTFVRCIKPNDARKPNFFESSKVITQLRYTGVLETIRIRQHGFSHRILFSDFLKRYCFLVYAFDERVFANRESARLLLIRLKMDGWALGKTKVFLKYYHIGEIWCFSCKKPSSSWIFSRISLEDLRGSPQKDRPRAGFRAAMAGGQNLQEDQVGEGTKHFDAPKTRPRLAHAKTIPAAQRQTNCWENHERA